MLTKRFRLAGTLLATAGMLTLSVAPTLADDPELCRECVHQCPEGAGGEEEICETLCEGTYQDAVCAKDSLCDRYPTRRYLLICQQEGGGGGDPD